MEIASVIGWLTEPVNKLIACHGTGSDPLRKPELNPKPKSGSGSGHVKSGSGGDSVKKWNSICLSKNRVRIWPPTKDSDLSPLKPGSDLLKIRIRIRHPKKSKYRINMYLLYITLVKTKRIQLKILVGYATIFTNDLLFWSILSSV